MMAGNARKPLLLERQSNNEIVLSEEEAFGRRSLPV
jgi:hypothetical protein